MKSSLSKVFDDISKEAITSDRIFQNVISSYSIMHYTSQYVYSSQNATHLMPTDRVYVVNTFNNSFEFTKETESTLLADETTRNAYNVLISQFSNEIKQIEEKLRVLTGLTKHQIKNKLTADLGLTGAADWTDIFEKINELYATWQRFEYLNDCTYSELFNDKVMAVYDKREFLNSVEEYISSLNTLLQNNPILNDRFTDRNAEILGKEMAKSHLFDEQHTIHLKDGVTIIHSLEEWNSVVNEQLERLYSTPELSAVFQKFKKILTSNGEVSRLRDIIIAHREIIPALRNIPALKVQTWLDCFSKLDMPFADYYRNISRYTSQIKALYEQASAQSERR